VAEWSESCSVEVEMEVVLEYGGVRLYWWKFNVADKSLSSSYMKKTRCQKMLHFYVHMVCFLLSSSPCKRRVRKESVYVV